MKKILSTSMITIVLVALAATQISTLSRSAKSEDKVIYPEKEVAQEFFRSKFPLFNRLNLLILSDDSFDHLQWQGTKKHVCLYTLSGDEICNGNEPAVKEYRSLISTDALFFSSVRKKKNGIYFDTGSQEEENNHLFRLDYLFSEHPANLPPFCSSNLPEVRSHTCVFDLEKGWYLLYNIRNYDIDFVPPKDQSIEAPIEGNFPYTSSIWSYFKDHISRLAQLIKELQSYGKPVQIHRKRSVNFLCFGLGHAMQKCGVEEWPDATKRLNLFNELNIQLIEVGPDYIEISIGIKEIEDYFIEVTLNNASTPLIEMPNCLELSDDLGMNSTCKLPLEDGWEIIYWKYQNDNLTVAKAFQEKGAGGIKK